MRNAASRQGCETLQQWFSNFPNIVVLGSLKTHDEHQFNTEDDLMILLTLLEASDGFPSSQNVDNAEI